jgi:hypothetical protein
MGSRTMKMRLGILVGTTTNPSAEVLNALKVSPVINAEAKVELPQLTVQAPRVNVNMRFL